MSLTYTKVGNRIICIGGVGTLYHEKGFPIGMSEYELSKRGVELSWFHVIKELEPQYTSKDRLWSKIEAEMGDTPFLSGDRKEVKRFMYGTKVEREQILFKYFFGLTHEQAMEHRTVEMEEVMWQS